MADPEYLALVNAELDGELNAQQRAELARRLLADPEARSFRDDMLRLRTVLDSIEQSEPPAQLCPRILQALPPAAVRERRSLWFASHWRYAALLACLVTAATLVYETVEGPGPGSAEIAGTMAARGAAPSTLDTVALSSGPVTGRVSLYRDSAGLGLSFDLVASEPVDVLITSDGHAALRLTGLGRGGSAGAKTNVALPMSGSGGTRKVDLTLLMSGHEVRRVTLTAPGDTPGDN